MKKAPPRTTLIGKIRFYNDDCPIEKLQSMKTLELEKYLEVLRETYPDDVADEPD